MLTVSGIVVENDKLVVRKVYFKGPLVKQFEQHYKKPEVASNLVESVTLVYDVEGEGIHDRKVRLTAVSSGPQFEMVESV